MILNTFDYDLMWYGPLILQFLFSITYIFSVLYHLYHLYHIITINYTIKLVVVYRLLMVFFFFFTDCIFSNKLNPISWFIFFIFIY